MRLLRSMLVVAALGLAGPVWAAGGHGHGHDGFRHDRHGHRHHSHWKHHGHYAHAWRYHYYDPYYYSAYYYPPYPRYGYAVAAPGVHIVVPNVYIPLR